MSLIQLYLINNYKRLVSQAVWYVCFFIVFIVLLDLWRARGLPNLALADAQYSVLTGGRRDVLSLSRDEPVLIYFWATWCGPCKLTSPAVERLSARYQVLSVAMASGSDAQLREYLQDQDYTFEVVNDNSQEISSSWNIVVTPYVLIVKNGKVIVSTSGISSYWGLWLRMQLAYLS